MAEDLKNAKLFLQQGLLTAETLDNFDLWKEDIVRAVKCVSLTGPEHWATVNWLIYNWLDDRTYQTISSFIPNNYEELRVINPAELLQYIEALLVTATSWSIRSCTLNWRAKRPWRTPGNWSIVSPPITGPPRIIMRHALWRFIYRGSTTMT